MSSPAAPLPHAEPTPAGLLASGRPLLALLRRDLVASGRGAMTWWTRALACVGSSAAVLIAFALLGQAGRNDAAAVGVEMLFLSLMAAGFLLAPAVAVSSLRREREAGMLDLLLLAGIEPRVLALGRILSTFLLYESLLFAALPAMALFWFFRQPGLPALALAAGAMTVHFLALAAVSVAVSAWSRHAGFAIALSLVVFGPWILMLVAGDALGLPVTVTTLLDDLLGPRGNAPSAAGTVISLAACAFVHLMVALVAWLSAATGLARSAPRTSRDKLRERIEKKPLRLRDRPPMTWLLQRGSAPARPVIQLAIVVPAVIIGMASGAETSAMIGATLLVCGEIAALALGATAIAPAKERGTWLSLISTSLKGDALMGDSLRGVLAGSVAPVAGGLLLTAHAMHRLSTGDAVTWYALGASSILVTWLLAAFAGLAASVAARTTAGALSLGAAFLVLEPLVSLGGASAYGMGNIPLADASGVAAWLMLIAAAAFGGGWLIIRAGWSTMLRASAALVPTVLLSLLPVLLGLDSSLVAVAPFVAASAFGLVLLTHGMRRERGVAVMSGVLLLLSCLVMPLAAAGLEPDQVPTTLFGGNAVIAATFVTAFGNGLPDPAPFVAGAMHHALIIFALIACFIPRLERWLGRAG